MPLFYQPTNEQIRDFAQDYFLKKITCPDYRLGQAWENYFDPPYELNLFHLDDVRARHKIETVYQIELSNYGI